MRGLSRNKQSLYYSLLGEPQPIYATDEQGNIIYDNIDGQQIPRETGDTTDGYADPVPFEGNIAKGTGRAEAESFGVDDSAYDAVLYVPKGKLPLEEMTLFWYKNEPQYKGGQVDKTSADYRVVRVPPCLDEMVYLLSKVV